MRVGERASGGPLQGKAVITGGEICSNEMVMADRGDGNKLLSVPFPDPICTLPVLKGNAVLGSVTSYFS